MEFNYFIMLVTIAVAILVAHLLLNRNTKDQIAEHRRQKERNKYIKVLITAIKEKEEKPNTHHIS